ncbi:hypothetical protein [Bradyrhizobium sp.]|jgi:hypothetical protein|uniref:hypothetical protein n=1 Tax=Bradyrhizobium sp. TaxID=376 RepID=UPI002E06A13C|nr:hypothetical protein [Bradyrhizobium sp.]
MKIPYEFEQFVRGIYPEDPGEFESLESQAAAALEHKVANERRVVLAFLNELLDGGHSDAELEHVWRNQSPRSNFSPGGHRVFFEEIRRQIIADKDRKLAQ